MCAFIKSCIEFVAIDVPSALLVFDVVGVHTKYHFILSYCAPGSHVNKVLLLTEAIDHFCASDASVVLFGDFNLPDID